VDEGHGLTLDSVDGHPIVRLHRFGLGGWAGPDAIFLVRDHRIYRLDPQASVLRRSSRHHMRRVVDRRAHLASMPPPTSAGDWDWTTTSSSGAATLGQWEDQFGECRMPVAMVRFSPSDPFVPITGDAPHERWGASSAMGWTSDGWALAEVPLGPCHGVPGYRMGLYAFTSAGVGTMVRLPRKSLAVAMWGP
jgi:hypothetical protein